MKIDIVPLHAGGRAVALIDLAPCAERYGAGDRAEVGEIRLGGGNAETSEIEHRYARVERTRVEPCARQPIKVVHQAENAHGDAQYPAREPHEVVGNFFRRTRCGVGPDIVDDFGKLAVDIEHGVGRSKRDLHGRFRRSDGCTALDREHDFNVIACIDAPSGHKAVHAGAHGYRTDVCGDDDVQKTEIGPTVIALFPQPFLNGGYLNAVRERTDGVTAAAQKERRDAVVCGQRADLPPFAAVTHSFGSVAVGHRMISFTKRMLYCCIRVQFCGLDLRNNGFIACCICGIVLL